MGRSSGWDRRVSHQPPPARDVVPVPEARMGPWFLHGGVHPDLWCLQGTSCSCSTWLGSDVVCPSILELMRCFRWASRSRKGRGDKQ